MPALDAVTARALADAVLVLHAAFVAFVVCGLAAILLGGVLGWRAVRDPLFRTLHFAAIGIVVAQAWAGLTCPLTTLEDALRAAAGDATYSGAFVAHWIERLLYWQLPPWVFVVGYTLFGAAVAAGWWWVPPRRFSDRPRRAGTDRDDAARPARAPDGP